MLGILEIRNGEIFLMSNDNIFLSHKSLCVTFNIVLLAFYFPPALLSLHYGQIFRIYIYIYIYLPSLCFCDVQNSYYRFWRTRTQNNYYIFLFSELETPGRIRLKFSQTEPGRIVVIKLETTRIQVLSDEVLSFCCRRRRSRNRYL